jgi:hypothetical protein
MRRTCIRVLAGTLAVGTAASAAAARQPLRFEELARVARLGGFDVSRDGRWIACAVGTPVVSENVTRSAIWLVSSQRHPAGTHRSAAHSRSSETSSARRTESGRVERSATKRPDSSSGSVAARAS